MSEEKFGLKEAIVTALEYENNVRDMYLDAAERATEEGGRQLFERLAREEQGHVDYLESRLEEWSRTGHVEIEEVEMTVPTAEMISQGLAQLENTVQRYDWTLELELLRKARQMEAETGSFYKRMVSELDEEGADLFRNFLEIEDAHYDLVQAQMEALEGGGFWFDAMEFSLEGA